KGASYTATFENFVAPASLTGGTPKVTLNVTDLAIAKDGAMDFLTGGRAPQAGLYRVSYQQPLGLDLGEVADAAAGKKSADEARALRRKLEAFHSRKNSQAVGEAWPHLDSGDRYIRYAARLAIESQPVDTWQDRALEEKRKRA